MRRKNPLTPLLFPLLSALLAFEAFGERFRVATYNVENYLLEPVGTRTPKPEAHRAKVAEMILSIRPDVIAFQEIGGTNALLEIQGRLAAKGLDLPHMELVHGADEAIQVGILSRFPIVSRKPHTNESFLLDGRRFRVSRGFLEVGIQPSPGYRFTLFTAHLKSKRTTAAADEAQLREQEARLLRGLVEERLKEKPDANIVVCGDFNDTKDSRAIRALVGGNTRTPLTDTRPVERNGDHLPSENPRWDPRHVAWTHFYGKEDTYSRFDYLLLSPGMVREWRREGSYLPVVADWGLASDHRPVVCEFESEER
jgi:endonuclease/exonuclease/phosphatase family metal-dependent hydrolase